MSDNLTRRSFLRCAAAAGSSVSLGLPAAALGSAMGGAVPGPLSDGRPAKVLVLGGTGFIGPHQVQSLLTQGHEVTLFNRGRSAPEMFKNLERLVGDRNGDYESLKGRQWDIVIDNAKDRPDWVRMAGEALQDSAGYYYFVSSRSVYQDYFSVPMSADKPTRTFDSESIDRETADISRLPYGLAKAESEREVMRIFPGRSGIFRPGLIVGPGDRTDRFTYWPVRIQRGGEVLAPGDPSDKVQIIDVRDLGDFMAHSSGQRHTGIFNLIGPATPRPMSELLYGIRAVTTAETSFTWVPTAFLAKRGIQGYREVPVWLPPILMLKGYGQFDLSREVAHGLRFRSLADTTEATLAYHFSRTPERQSELWSAFDMKREARVLKEWRLSQV
ncbi:MAG: NAD-dependent epimerase/dehydratase family protein [Pseudomonadota bacterium]